MEKVTRTIGEAFLWLLEFVIILLVSCAVFAIVLISSTTLITLLVTSLIIILSLSVGAATFAITTKRRSMKK